MPAVQRSEFLLALNQVANERGVDPSVVLETVKNAILAAYRKDHPGIEIEEYSVTLDQNSGEARIFHKEEDVTPPGFGRIAAQTAKQVILQKIREKEKEAILSDYKVRIGTIVNGMVLRFAGPNVIIDIGKAEGIMPPSEQIPNEKYHLNQRLAVHLLEIKEGPRGEEVVVSRASSGLIEGLFKREVPEVAQGSVVINAIARDPGNRCKVAVVTNQPGIDPVGSCVGQKGVRIQAIIQEFGGIEKIDVIQWQKDSKNYIAASLSPAKNVRVEIREEEKIANVFIAKDELSLAIGRDGQNVRLASKLTGYRIEIEGEVTNDSEVLEEIKEPKEIEVKASEGQVKEVKKDDSTASPVSKAKKKVKKDSAEQNSEKTESLEPIEEAKVEAVQEEKQENV